MKYNLYAVRDTKVGYMVPTADPNDAVAVRGFRSAVLRAHHEMDERVYDTELYKVGVYDVDTGEIMPIVPADFLVSAVSIIDGEKGE